MRGRLGLYKDDFLMLGGYNEDLIEYGKDDEDLFHRALEMGFISMAYGGEYHDMVDPKISPHHQEDNYNNKWWWTEGRNQLISLTNLLIGEYIANKGRHWGEGRVTKNFEEEVVIK